MTGIKVTSEIGRLRKVLLHRPGKELLNLTPDTLDRLLFDDIPYLKVAQKEHDAFARLLYKNGVEVVYLENLMAEVIEDENIKDEFLDEWISEGGKLAIKYKEEIKAHLLTHYPDNRALVLKTIEGISRKELNLKEEKTLANMVNKPTKLIVPPMPNTYFTRDTFASIGNGVSINKMYSVTRNRETIYAKYIFKYHKDFKDTKHFYERENEYNIEGGDILNISKNVLAVGISQRTSPEAIEKLAKNLLLDKSSKINTVVAIKIPSSRAFMHLDTVFTQVDYDKFTVHPGILGETLRVFEIKARRNGELKITEKDESLEELLSTYLKREVTLIECAGGDKIASEREQWNDGSNTLAIAPGVIVVYDRNDVTNKLLREHGIKVLEIPSSELSRGRGGPRCMSMPLIRDDIK